MRYGLCWLIVLSLAGCSGWPVLPAPELSIEPEEPGPGDTLWLVLEEVPSGDGYSDVVWETSWTVDDAPQPLLTGLTMVTPALTEPGQTWRAEVRARVGDLLGEPGEASVVIGPEGDDDDSGGDDDDVVDDDDGSPDSDDDGSPDDEDCDDEDPEIHPGATEVCGDGIDQDCSGADLVVDLDGDGHSDEACGGDDCDDGDGANYPGNVEVTDGQDNDCDGLVDGDDLVFVAVPAGTFTMGCVAGRDDVAGGCYESEDPSHTVTLTGSFWLAQTETTQDQWEGLMGNNPSYFGPGVGGLDCGSDCPVELVNWYEGLALANALSAAEGLPACYSLSGCGGFLGGGCGISDNCASGTYSCTSVVVTSPSGSVYDCEGYRLPTEAEWEYAARGGEERPFSGSSVVDTVAWHSNSSGGMTHPTGQLQDNALGLYDMSGNVSEWTWDWYDSYSSSAASDPVGPASGSFRVRRGGCWWDSPRGVRTADRDGDLPGGRFSDLGFRLARSIP